MKILYIDMDKCLVDFDSGKEAFSAEVLAEYAGREYDIPGINAAMRPMPGGIEAYRLLCELFDTYILSTAPWDNTSAWQYKVEWVKHHLDDVANRRLILSHHKNLNCGDFLVDDRPNNGAASFAGEWIPFGTSEFPDWPTVVDYLRDRAG